jgi:hypothetical protein
MEILLLFMAILTVASIIAISMLVFRLVVAALVKINSLETEMIQIKNKKKYVKKL